MSDFSIRRERREYPIPDQGVHKAVCTKAELKENPFPDADPQDLIVKLWWRLDSEYEGDDGESRNYMVFSRPFSRRFSPKANLSKLCRDLTGQEPWVQRTEVKEGGKTYDEYEFDHTCFENMECDIVVKHNESKGRVYANTESYITSAEQKKNNCALLPQTQEEKKAKTKKKKEPEEEEPVVTVSSDKQNVLDAIAEAKDEKALKDVHTLIIDGSSFDTFDKAEIDKAYEDKLASF